jgi:hypothetical protein
MRVQDKKWQIKAKSTWHHFGLVMMKEVVELGIKGGWAEGSKLLTI